MLDDNSAWASFHSDAQQNAGAVALRGERPKTKIANESPKGLRMLVLPLR
jgi:hypothetical protein